jgi:ferredoxin
MTAVAELPRAGTALTAVVDPRLLADIKRFGAADVSACFSCGTCTAICPLSSNDGTFPRRMIRYAQVGMRDALLGSKELWTCYQCGLCSDSCPTQADPMGFMASARRYAIARYDRTRLAWSMYTRPLWASLFAVGLAAFFALFMYASSGPQSTTTLALFGFIPEGLIHVTGIVVMAVAGLAGLAGIVIMAREIAGREGVTLGTVLGGRRALRRTLRALWVALGVEAIGQRRYRRDCTEVQEPEPWYRRRWLAHAATMWGFLGLLGATILDYGLSLIGVRPTAMVEPVWYPVRLLGTVAGIVMIYGVSTLILNRVQRSNRAARDSKPADWMLLVLLLVTGVTGFLVELSLYLPAVPTWGYWIFLFHVSVAMELVLLAPFIKFAHAIYRPVALFFLALAPERADHDG